MITADIITCKSYEKLCDFSYREGRDIPSDARSIFVPLEEITEFFRDAEGKFDKPVNIVSACSDLGICRQAENPIHLDMRKGLFMLTYLYKEAEYTELGLKNLEIATRCHREKCNLDDEFSVKMHSYTYSTFSRVPDYVNRWFSTNLSTNHEKMECIPFGIAPEKAEDVAEVMTEEIPRDKELYVNFQICNEDRMQIQRYFMTKRFEFTTVESRLEYKDYLRQLRRHKFAVCPPGNGYDSYRILEAVYMGCTPIVPLNSFTKHLQLPLVYIAEDVWFHIFYVLGDFDWQKFLSANTRERSFNLPSLNLSYWKERLNTI